MSFKKKFRVSKAQNATFESMHKKAIEWLESYPSGQDNDFNKQFFGPLYWHLLHTYFANCPEIPDSSQVVKILEFYTRFQESIPCSACREEFKSLNASVPYTFLEFARRGRHVLSYFAWLLHNHVNQRLGKPLMKITDAARIYSFDENKIGDHNIAQLKEYNLW